MISEKSKKLGDALVAIKVLTPDQLTAALETASKENAPSLISVLLESGFLTFKIFEKFVASTLGIQSTVITNRPLIKEAVTLIGSQFIVNHFVYPFGLKEENGKKTIALGMVDPTDEDIISILLQKTACRIIPVLISLPDFKAAMKKNFQMTPVEIKSTGKDEFIIVHTGAGVGPHKEDPPTDSNVVTKSEFVMTKTVQPKPGWDQKTTLGNFGPSSSAKDSQGKTDFIGKDNKKFREEILAKLDLDPVDAQHLQETAYDREMLLGQLLNIAAPKLQKIYNTLSTELKVEALINALIHSGVLVKQDLLASAAVSLAFSEEKK